MTVNRPDRKGIAMVPSLVCLVLVAVLSGAMLKLSLMQRTLTRVEEGRLQLEWLAESGAARASARLAADEAYQGEIWTIPARSLRSLEDGRVAIVVNSIPDKPGRRRVRIEAEFPRGEVRQARQTKQLIINLRPESPGGPS